MVFGDTVEFMMFKKKIWEIGSDLCSFFALQFSPNMLLSGSRDKNLIIWNLTRDEQAYGYPKRSLTGHSHIVSDCVCPQEPHQTGIGGEKQSRENRNQDWLTVSVFVLYR